MMRCFAIDHKQKHAISRWRRIVLSISAFVPWAIDGVFAVSLPQSQAMERRGWQWWFVSIFHPKCAPPST